MTIDQDIAGDFAALGVHVRPQEGSENACEVWDVNWKSFMAFDACRTQWRPAIGFSSYLWLGLEYAGVDVVLRRLGHGDAVFRDIQVMEAEALKTFSELR